MNFCLDSGDTNFIALVSASDYLSFVDRDWELNMLLQHFADEMNKGSILVYQMTEEGIEHSWNIEVQIGEQPAEQAFFRKATGYIRVTDNRLYLVDYDCLTMAAQFEDQKIPDKNCSKNCIDIENGIYRVDFVQYYNVDKNEYAGSEERDVLIQFTRVPDLHQVVDGVFWCTY